MDKKLFLQSLNSLESAFGEKLSEDRAKIYWDILKGYSDINIKKAVVKSIRGLKFFPKIAEIIEMIEGKIEDEAEIAWLVLKRKIESYGGYRSVSFPNNPAIGSVVEALGGWIGICDITVAEEKWIKKEFMKLYPIMKKRNNHPKKLTGIIEMENSQKGYSEEYMIERYGRLLDGSKIERKKLKGDNKIEKERRMK
ncbi:hypothetical protein ES695_11590 [Candidatus Atribacteria bacterium 1244-E10-H5-B2]|nr:MAG: hypothetical protein ES695_11590 [Candidatus Atribacteria bacterium 1244-E10-H5-B2]